MERRAVFLDRDGVLIEDVGLVTRASQVKMYSAAPAALRRLRSAGLAIVVVSNQAVVSRGMASESEVDSVNDWVHRLLRQGGEDVVDGFYYCPHHPNAKLPRYRLVCECRKPRPGLLVQAAKELYLTLSQSYLVGDRLSDIQAGYEAGCSTVLLETGRQTDPPIESPGIELEAVPDVICSDLATATAWILHDLL